MRKIFILLFIYIIVFSCSKNGEYHERYENGNIKTTYIYSDNNLIYRTTWNENGNKTSEFEIVNGKTGAGKFWQYYNDGVIKSEETFKDTSDSNFKIIWYKNGAKEFEGNYVNGVLDGKYTEWYENGQKREEGTHHYHNNKRNGLTNKWYDNGQIEYQGEYYRGAMHGEWSFWHNNGNLKEQYNYKNGKKDGSFKKWHKNGIKEYEGKYTNGTPVGIFIEWDENGNKLFESNNLNGKVIIRSFNKNGQKDEEFEYVNGKRASGKKWSYHMNGRPFEKVVHFDTTDTYVYEIWYDTGNLEDYYLMKGGKVFRTWDFEKYPHKIDKYDYKKMSWE